MRLDNIYGNNFICYPYQQIYQNIVKSKTKILMSILLMKFMNTNIHNYKN